MLELMARGGMRIGEVLNLTPRDVEDRKLIICDPKSGREIEIVFIPRKVADRLNQYIRDKGIEPGQKIFPITYSAARAMVVKSGKMVGILICDHMISGVIRHLMHHGQGRRSKSSARSFYAMQTFRPHKDIWGKSAIKRLLINNSTRYYGRRKYPGRLISAVSSSRK